MSNPKPIEVKDNDRLLLVSINQSYDQSKAEGIYKRPDLYECTRKYWYLRKSRADKADYILGIYKGIVQIVIKPTTQWQPVNISEDGFQFPKTRYKIEGEMIDDSPYLGTSVADYPFGSGGSITYIPRDIKKW